MWDSDRNQVFKVFLNLGDETTHETNREQVVIEFQYVDETIEAHEDFIGLHRANPIYTTNILVKTIENTLLRMNLPLSKYRGPCYDTASISSGVKNGAVAHTRQREPRAVHTHCCSKFRCRRLCNGFQHFTKYYGHCIWNVRIYKEVSKRRYKIEITEEHRPESPGFRVLCPTRWTVRATSLQNVLINYVSLQKL